MDLLPLAASTREHLTQYGLIDIGLDPWPYAGTTTTAEAMYMGVPCLTLRGACHAHNVGASLLAAVGLGPGWVAGSVGGYVAAAAALAADLPALAALRGGLRGRLLVSSRCDGPAFVERLEDVYHSLWRCWVGGGGRTCGGQPAAACGGGSPAALPPPDANTPAGSAAGATASAAAAAV